MSTIAFHRAPDPAGRPAGKPYGGPMSSRDPLVAARLAKRIVHAGKWRTLPGRDDRARILTAIGSQARWAVLILSSEAVDALVALGKEVTPGLCHWDAARLVRGAPLERDPVTVALLGEGCARCRACWAAAEVAARERTDLARVAGGAPTMDAVAAVARARRVIGRTPLPSYYEPGPPRR
jgi:hypothetical protein